MKKYLFCALLFLSSTTSATEQITDSFIIADKTFEIEPWPLGNPPLESLYTGDQIHQMLQLDGWCSANWRGYKATWELIDNQLYLTKLVKEACSENPPIVDPNLFFGEEKYPVKAAWFSQTIEIRVSKVTTLYCGNNRAIEQSIGESYDADVYEFSAGELVSQSTKKIEKLWKRDKQNCEITKEQ